MHWFLDPIQKHYADFEGRVGRQEFWMFVLVVFGINIALSILHLDMVGTLVSLALLVPNLAIGARRLHDTGRSGWWQLLALIPIVGWIILIVCLAQETTPTDNEYGAPAKPKVVAGGAPAAATPAAAAPMADAATMAPTTPAEPVTSTDSEEHRA